MYSQIRRKLSKTLAGFKEYLSKSIICKYKIHKEELL